MDKRGKRARAVELGKDVLIVLLLCSAVWLLARSQLFHSNRTQDHQVSSIQTQSGTRADTARPLRMTANLEGSADNIRYGVQYDAGAADALPESDEEKEANEKKAEANKPVLDFVKEVLGDKVSAVRISKVLKSAPVCMTAEGGVSLEMEKYFSRMEAGGGAIKAERVLELNADSAVYGALAQAVAQEPEKAKKYAELLYDQALIIAGLPVEDTARYTELVCSLMN